MSSTTIIGASRSHYLRSSHCFAVTRSVMYRLPANDSVSSSSFARRFWFSAFLLQKKREQQPAAAPSADPPSLANPASNAPTERAQMGCGGSKPAATAASEVRPAPPAVAAPTKTTDGSKLQSSATSSSASSASSAPAALPSVAVAAPAITTTGNVQAGFSEVDCPAVRPSSGRKLPGTLTVPSKPNAAHPRGVVVMCHGLFSGKEHNFAPQLAGLIASELGLHAFRFDFRSGPDAATEPDFTYTFPGFPDDASDLEAALATVRGRGLTPMVLLGHSKGANVVLMAAAEAATAGRDAALLSSLKAVVAVAPRFHMEGMLKSLFKDDLPKLTHSDSFQWTPNKPGWGPITITRAIRDYVLSLNMASVAAALPPSLPVLIAHGTLDQTISHKDADAWAVARVSSAPVSAGVTSVAKLKCGHKFEEPSERPRLLVTVLQFIANACGVERAGASEALQGVAAVVPQPAPTAASPQSSSSGAGGGGQSKSAAKKEAKAKAKEERQAAKQQQEGQKGVAASSSAAASSSLVPAATADSSEAAVTEGESGCSEGLAAAHQWLLAHGIEPGERGSAARAGQQQKTAVLQGKEQAPQAKTEAVAAAHTSAQKVAPAPAGNSSKKSAAVAPGAGAASADFEGASLARLLVLGWVAAAGTSTGGKR